MLGLTYKPGTNTLRRSSAIELCRWLHERGVRVRGHDPAVDSLPPDLHHVVELTTGPLDALTGRTWPSSPRNGRFPRSDGQRMSTPACDKPRVLDPNHFLADVLGNDPRIHYFATGKRAA